MNLILSTISPGLIVLIVVIVVLLLIAASGFRVVPQAQAYVIERLGAYYKTWNTVFIIWCHFFTGFLKKSI